MVLQVLSVDGLFCAAESWTVKTDFPSAIVYHHFFSFLNRTLSTNQSSDLQYSFSLCSASDRSIYFSSLSLVGCNLNPYVSICIQNFYMPSKLLYIFTCVSLFDISKSRWTEMINFFTLQKNLYLTKKSTLMSLLFY